MEKSAQEEIVQSTDKATEDLHQGVGEQLTNLKQPTQTVPHTEQAIPLTEELKEFGVNATHVVGSKFEELTTGVTPTTHMRGTRSSKLLSFGRKRAAQLAQLVGLKKAA